MENINSFKGTECLVCGVPSKMHNTACGWLNANIILNPQDKEQEDYMNKQIAAYKEAGLNYPIFTNVDQNINQRICYKTSKTCPYNCSGLCRDSY